VCVGFFATKQVNPKIAADGLFYGGGPRLLGVQVLGLIVVVGYSLGATLLIGWLIGRLVGNRVPARQERVGLDLSQHGEVAYGPGTPEATAAPDLPPDPDIDSVVASTASENLPSYASSDGKARGRLAEAHPADYLPDLASSLNNLGAQLSELGRHAEAAAAIEEAVIAYRRLAQTSHNAFEPELATALDGLSTRLEELSRLEEGRSAIDEAITVVYRRLAHTNPDGFLPDLAAALNKQSIHLEEQGRREECLAAIEEAVAIYRRLAQANPDAFLPGLAASLINLERLRPQPGEHERAQPDQSGSEAVPASRAT
jgi:hypothetical protein